MEREVISKFKDKTFCDIGIDLTTSEYGPSEDGEDAGGTKHATGFLFYSSAYHWRSVIASGCAHEAQEGNRILSLKLSERVSPFIGRLCRCFSFSFEGSFSFKNDCLSGLERSETN